MKTLFPSRKVNRAMWQGEWPLTIDGGFLQLRTGNRVVLVFKQKIYGVNDAAKAERHFVLDQPRYVPIDEVWRDDPRVPGLKISLGPLIAMGLGLRDDDK